jgi:hypothetical protein
MRYRDGNLAKIGDVLRIDDHHSGVVVGCMDDGAFLPGFEQWGYLQHGVMVDTSFGGLVHYTEETCGELALDRRANAV